MKLWISAVLFAALAQCPAADPVAMLTELRAILKKELKAGFDKADKGENDGDNHLAELESLLVEKLPDKEVPDETVQQTIQALREVRTASKDKKAAALAEQLVDELRRQSKEAAKRLQEKFNGTLGKCLRDGLKAAKAKEVDAPLRELSILKRKVAVIQNRNGEVQAQFNSEGMQAVENLLRTYQGMLFAAEEKGFTDYDPEQMGSSSDEQFAEILPRSEFLQLMHGAQQRLPKDLLTRREVTSKVAEQEISKILAKVKKPEELDDAMREITELVVRLQHGRGGFSDNGMFNELKSIQSFHQSVLAGTAPGIEPLFSYSTTGDPRVSRIRAMVLRVAVPRLLGVAADKGMKDGEALADFLRRTVSEAAAAHDWPLLSRVVEMNPRIMRQSSPESVAFQNFFAGQNQEKARQYTPAVASYLAALKSGSQNIPVDFIGERLAAIEKEHPEEYRAAMQAAGSGSGPRSSTPRALPPTPNP